MDNKKDALLSLEAKWQEGIRDWEGNLPERMVNDQSEERFWQELLKKKNNAGEPDPYAVEVMKYVTSLLSDEDDLLEIGPGWGNYTFSLAEQVKKLTLVDSSSVILDFLKQLLHKRTITDVEFIHEKWEHINLSKDYDVIFGFNCFYRMFEIKKALLSIHKHSKRLAIIGMTTGPIQPHYLELHREYGYDVKFPRKDYIDLLNLLYNLGIYADCKVIPLTRKQEYSTYEECLEKNMSKILTRDIDVSLVEDVLSKYIVHENGRYIYQNEYNAAVISWRPDQFSI
ncbi:DNA-binding NarL/FixJ family response regulator [Metabacillus crassostreae]|uniref:class I SAM-dependent methyltransferase n=1 Tax=Metabacillus crassostreae TaxID=929098 RepID=UPI001959F4D4|nr:class I SAM-dependent methyltransferase [Metabacillus crassostreae]MBM7605019.1 DNA-binding NarL/FixJ family response regulator [Metabacillus crassostreae]